MQKGCQQRRTEEEEELTPFPKLLAELRRAKRASETPWVRKFGKPSIREHLVMTYVAYTRTLFAGEGRESGVSPSGGGVCYKSPDAFVQPAFFLAGKSRKKWRSCRRVQKHVYFNYFIA